MEKENIPVPITFDDRITETACGLQHTLFLTSNGEVLATGGNTYG